ncbi:MAG: response regulator transcription factor [Candidatus Omnitrophica bacterium]|nr:response regulator transcription factor [Candidatus Omnitrophota bacterium]
MLRILIIEDHKDFRQAVRQFLELNHLKAQIMEAGSGEEGVIMARKSKPRVVIMGFDLEGINSIEAASWIKENDSKCHIIMLTMFDATEIVMSERNRDIKAFIGKSEIYDQLIPTIDKCLNNN